ncbi:MAG: deoxyuridine 5'-triphosphate nucleotidohydrolase [Desulfurococcales archaeon]|nr:deoxyuridine 5'-triphosphate nucleotidohydrolase [Desulfurococcales archaeon]
MFLSGRKIVADGIVGVLDPSSEQPAGVDLTLDYVEEFGEPGLLGRAERRVPRGVRLKCPSGLCRLGPGAYRVRFREEVRVPSWAVGLCFPRSSLLRMGAQLSCAVWDPGYRGRGAALLAVYNTQGIEIELGARIAQLVIARLEEAPASLYRGAYLGEGVTRAAQPRSL